MGIRSSPGLGKAVSPREENDWLWSQGFSVGGGSLSELVAGDFTALNI